MEDLFVPYELVLGLKELGFDEENILGYYRGNRIVDLVEYKFTIENYPHIELIPAPLYQQAFKFFREKYKLESSIQRMPPEIYAKGNVKNYLLYIWAENLNPRGQKTLHFDAYEEAELECIKKLIELVKK